jgi:ankyrin repeat protein
LFLKYNPNLEVIEVDGKWSASVLTQAIRTGRIDCAKMLLEAGANPKNSLQEAVTFDKPECLKMLTEYLREDIDKEDSCGWTPLQWAAVCNSVDCTKILVEAGANVFLKDKSWKTAYDLAKERKCQAVTKYFEGIARIKLLKGVTGLKLYKDSKIYEIPLKKNLLGKLVRFKPMRAELL